jgi:hypothetical protein
LALFFWQGNKDINLSDEGSLWYCSQRVMLGEVPIRDFFSYDPGRYYWSASVMSLLGDNGIMALRGSVALFQALGLFIALLLISRARGKQNFLFLILAVLILAVWMFPRHKIFDISLSILLIGALTFLIEKPILKRYFLSGLCIGFVAVFGRNHGLYGACASIGVIAWLSIKRLEGPGLIKGASHWLAGLVAGYIPILLMVLFVPGFARIFWGSICYLFEIKTTNLSIPIPWPWQVPFDSLPFDNAIRGVLIGLFFIAIVLWGVLLIFFVVRKRFCDENISAALVATCFLALPYAHYAYSRADVSHLAQGIFPFLVGSLVYLATQPAIIKWPLTLVLCFTSLLVMHVYHPGWQFITNKQWVNIEISGDTLQVPPSTAKDIQLVRNLTEKYAQGERNVLVTPLWPGAYAILKKKSPMWSNYSIFPRSTKFQNEENERIAQANPGFALVIDSQVDGREEFRFRNSHSVIYQFIESNFQKIDARTGNPDYLVYVKKF